MDSAMYFRACAMVRSGHQDLFIAQLTVRLKYTDVKGGGGGGVRGCVWVGVGVCVCVIGEEGAVRVAMTVIRRWKRMIQGDGSSTQRRGDFTKPYKSCRTHRINANAI